MTVIAEVGKLDGHGGSIGEGDGIMGWHDLEEIQKWAVSEHSHKTRNAAR